MARLQVTVNAKPAILALTQVAQRVTDLRPVLEGPINKSIDMMFKRQFDSEGKYGGTPWAKHSAVTKLMRKAPGHGRGGVLRDTNRLWGSLTKLGLGPDAIRVITKTSITRGTSVPYAQYHQRGYPSVRFPVWSEKKARWFFIPRKRVVRVPARPIVPDPVPAPLVAVWNRVLAQYVTEQKNNAP